MFALQGWRNREVNQSSMAQQGSGTTALKLPSPHLWLSTLSNPMLPFHSGIRWSGKEPRLVRDLKPIQQGGDVTFPSHAVLTCHYPGSWWPKEIQTGHTCAPGEGSTNPHWALPSAWTSFSFSFFAHRALSQNLFKASGPGWHILCQWLCSSNVVKEPQWRWDGGIGNGKSPTDASPFLSWTIHSSLGRWTF